MENLDRKNFEDRVFDELPDLVLCSNFRHCTFNAPTKFERCNLMACTFNADCEYDRTNVISQEELDEMEAHDREVRPE